MLSDDFGMEFFFSSKVPEFWHFGLQFNKETLFRHLLFIIYLFIYLFTNSLCFQQIKGNGKIVTVQIPASIYTNR